MIFNLKLQMILDEGIPTSNTSKENVPILPLLPTGPERSRKLAAMKVNKDEYEQNK